MDGRAAWIRLALSLLAATVGNVGMWAVVVVLPDMQAEFGVGRGATSAAYTVAMLGFALGNWLVGSAVDRWGLARVLALATVANAAAFAAAAASPSFALVVAVHFAIGLATAVNFGPLIADVSRWFRARRGLAVAIVASGNYLSGAIWPFLIRDILAEDGWRAVYLVLAVAVAALVLPLCLALRAPAPADEGPAAPRPGAPLRRLSRLTPGQIQALLVAAGVACCVAMSMPQVHIVAYCTDLGYGPAIGAEMLSLMLLGGVASRLASGWLADRIGGIAVVLIGSAGQGLALLLYIPADGLVSLYVVSLIFGLSQGGIVPTYALIVRDYLPAREAGARVGLVMMATILGMALGGWMSGAIYDATGSYRLAFVNGMAWNLMNLGLLLLLLASTRSPRRLAPA